MGQADEWDPHALDWQLLRSVGTGVVFSADVIASEPSAGTALWLCGLTNTRRGADLESGPIQPSALWARAKANTEVTDCGLANRVAVSMAVVVMLSKGYDLDYVWRQVPADPALKATGYSIGAAEVGGEPPGRWWGQAAPALCLRPVEIVERPHDLLFRQQRTIILVRWVNSARPIWPSTAASSAHWS